MKSIFHLALNVSDLEIARNFYGTTLGCVEGRSTASWVDFDFFGHQLSLHEGKPLQTALTGDVGGQRVPMPHFGVILSLSDWTCLAERLTQSDITFVVAPQLRFAGQPGEQWTMFFRDPFGNPLEIKGFRELNAVYAR